MPTDVDVTADVSMLQLLPEDEPSAHGVHLLASCNLTCPWWTSDSVPSTCCN
jgi:hypothetical protein